MARFWHDVLIVALGMTLVLPWIVFNCRFQEFFYGLRRHSAMLRIAGWPSFLLLVLMMLAAALGASFVAFYGQDLLVLFGVLPAMALGRGEALWYGGGIVFAVTIGVWKWKQRRFLHLMEEAPPRCANCQYILKGVPSLGHSIRCPECGHVETLRGIVARLHRDEQLVLKEKGATDGD